MKEFRHALWEVGKAALVYVVYCLIVMSVLAAIVKAASPSEIAVTISCWVLKCIGCFVVSLLFLRSPRALFKGLAAGALCSVLSMLAFAAIGGGFHLSLLYLLELPLCALMGGAGALLSAKLRKEA